MIEEYFKPLALQIDSGFGSTADSFYSAAQALESTQDHKYGFGMGGGKLPLLYLYRHCIELYLKSAITLIERLKPNHSDNDEDVFPTIKENGKNKKIFNVHSINTLFLNYLETLERNKIFIKSRSGYDWFVIPKEISFLIEQVEKYDKNSTMFRYPVTMDSNLDYEKSTFKKCVFENKEIVIDTKLKSKPNIFLLVQGDNNDIVESYVSDNDAVTEIHDVLKELASQLSGLHFGLTTDLIR